MNSNYEQLVRQMHVLSLVREHEFISKECLLRELGHKLSISNFAYPVSESARIRLLQRDIQFIADKIHITISYDRHQRGYYIAETEDDFIADLEEIFSNFDLLTAIQPDDKIHKYILPEHHYGKGSKHLRYDLVPMLVNCVKGYAAHEYKTLKAVVAARNMGLKANSEEECFKAARKMDRGLKKLFALAESYPNLKADKIFMALHSEIAVTECYIAQVRSVYNDVAREYNDTVLTWPASIVARSRGFRPDNISIVPDEDREKLNIPPAVNFD